MFRKNIHITTEYENLIKTVYKHYNVVTLKNCFEIENIDNCINIHSISYVVTLDGSKFLYKQ